MTSSVSTTEKIWISIGVAFIGLFYIIVGGSQLQAPLSINVLFLTGIIISVSWMVYFFGWGDLTE